MMFTLWAPVILSLVSTICCDGSNRLSEFTKPEDYMDTCMKGVSHKEKPGHEADLFQKCKPWKERSCCTQDVTNDLHINKTWYNMDYSHCETPMSAKCRARFIQDLCFYECSPNVGPWLVKVESMKIREERFVNVPLCQTECDAWWEDCQFDYTCVENWSRHFNWSTGMATCPDNTECKTFREVFKNSTNFCQKVWDHSWEVVEDKDPNGCFVMWWNEGAENPNYQIALNKAQLLVSDANSHVLVNFMQTILLIACIFLPAIV